VMGVMRAIAHPVVVFLFPGVVLLVFFFCVHTHTHTHTHTHSHSLTYTHTHSLTRIHTHTDHLADVEDQAFEMLRRNEDLEARMAALQQRSKVCDAVGI
jgi:branched-subunit amino acid permease